MKKYTLKNLNKKRLTVVALFVVLPILVNQCDPKPTPNQLRPIVTPTFKPTPNITIKPTTKPIAISPEPVIEKTRKPMLDNEEVTGLSAVGMERTIIGFVSGTCADLKAIGLEQFPQGDVNYTADRDHDRDGIACE